METHSQSDGKLVAIFFLSRLVDRKTEARNLLSNMLGFTRHERLDVKKPGPPAAPPPSSQSPHETPKLLESTDKKVDINKEVLPTLIKG